jgi:hypothetical protein
MADQKEQKLGAVTYLDPDKTGQPVGVKGVTFAPNEAINVNELFAEDEAEQLKKDLANNPHFRVEGGPDHRKILEGRAQHQQQAEQARQRIVDKQVANTRRGEPQPPPDWKGPAEARLETPAPKRK